MIGLVWAQSANGVIGARGRIPWHVPEDLVNFSALTLGATVVMGRATWESLPPRYRPLPGRRNVVLSRERGYAAPGAEVTDDLAAALASAPQVWVVGGQAVYQAALEHADRLVVTEVDLLVDGDTSAPVVGQGWRRAAVEPAQGWATSAEGPRYRTVTWERDPSS